jgi:hypothetical protein
LLPLYPYGRRQTLVRELVPNRIWSFEQLHGVWYVAVPIRMTVIKVDGGLLLYSPLPPTAEVLEELRKLEAIHGRVCSIVLATASGLEHKLPAPALSRAFPAATLWLADHQWSFPVNLPGPWLGFHRQQTKVLVRDGLPHSEQLKWIPIGPLDLGLGTFYEVACLDLSTGSLLVTDALVSISAVQPPVFDLDPRPLLFHARDCGSEPMCDTKEQRIKGWKRIVLFANFLRPSEVEVPPVPELLRDMLATADRSLDNHFGFYPFRWSENWLEVADHFLSTTITPFSFRLAPILERLVFVRAQAIFLDWLTTLSQNHEITSLIPSHYQASVPLTSADLSAYRDRLESQAWAPSESSWQALASIDRTLLKLRLVPHPAATRAE